MPSNRRMHLSKLTAAAALVLLPLVSGCVKPVLPRSAPRAPVPVNASMDRTWETVLALFAERNMTVTEDRTAGTITTSSVQLPPGDTGGEDCPNQTYDQILRPQYVTYRVGIKAEGTSSAVVAFALYARMPGPSGGECASRGTWETQFEGEVKRRAEQP